MLISFSKIKKLAIIAAIVIIPFIGINILNRSLAPKSHPVSQIADNIPAAGQVIKNGSGQSDRLGFFAEFRMERERVRGKQLELLREIANNPSNNQKVRDTAALKLVQVSDIVEKEMQTETLIKSKGYRDCAVILETDRATILLDASRLAEDQQAEITELTSHTTGLKEDKITITSSHTNN